MSLDPEFFKLAIIVSSVVASNWAAVYVIKAQMRHIDRRVSKNEANIINLFNDTRYVMTGNEIRRILHEEVNPLRTKVDIMHELVITLKAQNTHRVETMRTRKEDYDDA